MSDVPTPLPRSAGQVAAADTPGFSRRQLLSRGTDGHVPSRHLIGRMGESLNHEATLAEVRSGPGGP